MQNFTNIPSTTKVRESLGLLLDNDRTALSNSAGEEFPTSNLLPGMFCFRTDLGKLYQLIDPEAPIWKEVYDTTKNILHREDADETYLPLFGGTIVGTLSIEGGLFKDSSAVATLGHNQTFTKAQRSQRVSNNAASGPITLDFAAGNDLELTLIGNTSIIATNRVAGQSGLIIIVQNEIGGWTTSWGSDFKFPDGEAPELPLGANTRTVIPYYIRASNEILCGHPSVDVR